MKFTCIECENHYTPNVDGDAEERTCYNCSSASGNECKHLINPKACISCN